MIAVLIALTNVVSQHATNQALLAALAEPLTQALAAWLPTFPKPPQIATPEASLTDGHSCARTSAQPDSAAVQNTKARGPTEGMTFETVIVDPSKKTQKPAKSALTIRLKGPKKPSLLTAKLKGTMLFEDAVPESHASAKPATSALASQLGGPQATTLLTGNLKDNTPIEPDILNLSASEDSTEPRRRGSASAQGGVSREWGVGLEEDMQGQLARRFTYHVLLHLPVEILKDRQAFWMEHAVGLPELMLNCLAVAAVQDPEVSS